MILFGKKHKILLQKTSQSTPEGKAACVFSLKYDPASPKSIIEVIHKPETRDNRMW